MFTSFWSHRWLFSYPGSSTGPAWDSVTWGNVKFAFSYKPGFVKTGMTAGLDPPPFAGEPDDVARLVLRAIDRGTPVVYAPPIWGWIMLVIRHLPRAVMRRIGF